MASLVVGFVFQGGFAFGSVHAAFTGDEVQNIFPNLYLSGVCDLALLRHIQGVVSEMLSCQSNSSVLSASKAVSGLLGSCNSSFLLGGIDFSGIHMLVFDGEAEVKTLKSCNYAAIGVGAQTALGVLSACFLPGMSVDGAKRVVMQALFSVIIESNDNSLNGSVFIVGFDSFLPSPNCVFRHGRVESSKERFYLNEIRGDGTTDFSLCAGAGASAATSSAAGGGGDAVVAKEEGKIVEGVEPDCDVGIGLFD